jgi:hypothetical protein
LKKTILLDGLPYSHHLQFLRKNGTIRVVTDFRKLNLLWICHPFPIPKIGEDDMIRSMEGFTFASESDLSMGCYHIKLDHDDDSQKLCTIVIPWRKYKYKRLPMGIKIAWFLMFFKMSSKLAQNMEYVNTIDYHDDMLKLTNTNTNAYP